MQFNHKIHNHSSMHTLPNYSNYKHAYSKTLEIAEIKQETDKTLNLAWLRMRLQEYGAHGLSYTCIHLHVLVASIRQPWKLKRVQESRRVGALEYSRSCTSKKWYKLGFLGLLYLGQLHCPFHTWADNPLPYMVQNRVFGLDYKV